jgi:MFS family permease
VGLLLFREPRPEQRPPELAIVGSDGRQVLAGYTLDECTRNRRFWVLIASTALISFAYAGGLVHLPQMLKGAGFTPAQVAPIMSVWGAAIFLGRIGSGLLLDRFWAPLVMLPILAMPALGCFMLANDSLGYGAAVIAAVLFGLSSGAETDLIAYLASRYFGMAHYGKIYGVIYMTFGIGSALSPVSYAAVRDITGSYDLILYVCAGMFVSGALLLLTMGKYPRFDAAQA